jgi:hypothetical protein
MYRYPPAASTSACLPVRGDISAPTFVAHRPAIRRVREAARPLRRVRARPHVHVVAAAARSDRHSAPALESVISKAAYARSIRCGHSMPPPRRAGRNHLGVAPAEHSMRFSLMALRLLSHSLPLRQPRMAAPRARNTEEAGAGRFSASVDLPAGPDRRHRQHHGALAAEPQRLRPFSCRPAWRSIH